MSMRIQMSRTATVIDQGLVRKTSFRTCRRRGDCWPNRYHRINARCISEGGESKSRFRRSGEPGLGLGPETAVRLGEQEVEWESRARRGGKTRNDFSCEGEDWYRWRL